MSLLTSTNTGMVWPGELEVGRIDAPAVQYAVDPTLPILGYDKYFESDQIVIGRGRLVGLKGDAEVSSGAIATSSGKAHINYITVADGVNVAPLGYAASAISLDWAASGMKRTMPQISRNYMIAVPFVNGVNTAYGSLTQGDRVTALKSADPRLTGSVVKYVGRRVVTTEVTEADTYTSAIPAVEALTPVTLAAYGAAGAYLDPSLVQWAADGGVWVATSPGLTSLTFCYGQGAEMIAGEVYSLETTENLPGFLEWVQDNFGSWQVYPMFKALGNNAAEDALELIAEGEGLLSLITRMRIDPAKDIKISVVAGEAIYVRNNNSTEVQLYEGGDNVYLPKADFFGSNNCQGKNYQVDPTTGDVQYFGLYSDAAGTVPLTGDEAAAALELVASAESASPEPAFGTGLIGTVPNGIPSQYLKDPVTGSDSIGILKVAIH